MKKIPGSKYITTFSSTFRWWKCECFPPFFTCPYFPHFFSSDIFPHKNNQGMTGMKWSSSLQTNWVYSWVFITFTQKDTCSTLLLKYWTVLIGYSSSNCCYFLLKVQNLYQVLFCFIYTNTCDTIPLMWGSAGWREGITWPELVSGGA